MISTVTEQLNQNLLDWKLVSVSSTKIEIDLDFKDPLKVSQGEQPDKLFIMLNLQQFQDENGNSIQPGLLKEIDLPT